MAKPRKAAKIPLLDLPEGLLGVIDAVAKEHLGRNDATGDALAREVAALSALYTRERGEIGTDDRTRLAAARLRFFLPRDLLKIAFPLNELRGASLLPKKRTWTVLDLGAGLGATSLGVARFAHASGLAETIDVVAIDPFEAGLSLFEALAARVADLEVATLRVRTRTGEMTEQLPRGPFDLIVLGLSLNEWARGRAPEEAAALLTRIARHLEPDGSLVVIEPALRDEARFLQSARDVIAASEGAPTIFAPCVGPEPCPMLQGDRDWCHSELPLELPEALADVARGAGLRRSRPTFAYLTLRRDGRNVADRLAPGTHRAVSESLTSKGKRELFVCGGGRLVRLRRMNREESEANDAFTRARRGDLLALPPELQVERGKARLRRDDEVSLQGGGLATEPPN